MGLASKIEWTEATWNPVTGCTKTSPGCRYCYAERLALRLQKFGMRRYANGFNVTLHPEALTLPLAWRDPCLIFVDSMGDLFHEQVPVEFIVQVFEIMTRAQRHTFQVLTKRAERLGQVSACLSIPENVWLGVSVESDAYLERVDCLRAVPSKIRFLSLEPLLGPLPRLSLDGIQWVVVGGESGPRARPIQVEWVRQIRDQCLASEIPFFFKQWGGPNRRAAGRVLDGRLWNDMPLEFQRPLKKPASVASLLPA